MDSNQIIQTSFDSIEYGDNIDNTLLDLFQRILDRNPETRITMQELRVRK